ncbi:alpha/beta fold hydrolase [Corynebacterium poyangense]|uniref:alpha/beta fold hydrolase n=1 Tax=Corynebacterium poyangense TaxID=2684405 RepID=UPI002962295B|nr:alpha/beta hydrolase [Corynebacterium poyangense]
MLDLLRRCYEDEPQLYQRIQGIILVSTSIEALSDQGIPQVLALPAADNVYQAVEASPKEVRKLREMAASLLAPSLAVGVFRRPTDYELVEFHAAMINETPLESFVGFFGDLQNHDELAAAEALATKPGFVLVGDKDDVTPEEQADRICEVWPKAWYQVAKGAGHMVNLEAPELLNKAIDQLVDLIPWQKDEKPRGR